MKFNIGGIEYTGLGFSAQKNIICIGVKYLNILMFYKEKFRVKRKKDWKDWIIIFQEIKNKIKFLQIIIFL